MIFVISGASGIGKTTIAADVHEADKAARIYDLDDFGASSVDDDGWRIVACRRVLETIEATYKCRQRHLVFGQIVVPELLTIAQASGLASAFAFALLDLDEQVRKGRLLERGWSGKQIADQDEWMRDVRFRERALESGAALLPITGLDRLAVLSSLVNWIEERERIAGSPASPNPPGHSSTIKSARKPLIRACVDRSGGSEPHSDRKYPMSSKTFARDGNWPEAIAKCTTLEEICQLVKARPALSNADIYHPVPFREMASLKSVVNADAFSSKLNWISEEICRVAIRDRKSFHEVSVLDVGANAGGLAFHLSNLGFSVTASEPDPNYFALGKRISEIAPASVTWRHEALHDKVGGDGSFDVALLLSVFQWAAKGGAALEEAGTSLHRLSERCKHMIFELGFNEGYSCLQTEEQNQYGALIGLLLRYTCYTDFALLGTSVLYEGQTRYVVHCTTSQGRTGRAATPEHG